MQEVEKLQQALEEGAASCRPASSLVCYRGVACPLPCPSGADTAHTASFYTDVTIGLISLSNSCVEGSAFPFSHSLFELVLPNEGQSCT